MRVSDHAYYVKRDHPQEVRELEAACQVLSYRCTPSLVATVDKLAKWEGTSYGEAVARAVRMIEAYIRSEAG